MRTNLYEDAKPERLFDEPGGARQLWSAVLLQALEDWRSHSLGRHLEAERFLFRSEKDLASVCRRAGLEVSSVAARLKRMKQNHEKLPQFAHWQFA